jgi:hypothetical protein
MKRRYDRDMEAVVLARAFLSATCHSSSAAAAPSEPVDPCAPATRPLP